MPGWGRDRRASGLGAGRDRPRPARLVARPGADGGGPGLRCRRSGGRSPRPARADCRRLPAPRLPAPVERRRRRSCELPRWSGPSRRRPPDRARAPAARRARPARPRDRRGRLRRQPHLRQHPDRRLRPLHRPRADDPRAARPAGPRARCRGTAIRAEGERRLRRGRLARRAPRRDPRAPRPGGRPQPARLGPRRRARRPLLRPGPHRPAAAGALGRLPAAACSCSARRSSPARPPSGSCSRSAPRLLAALTLAGLRGYRALAVACGLTTAAYAIDVDRRLAADLALADRAQPRRLGVRFYGIGNELEAILALLVSSAPARRWPASPPAPPAAPRRSPSSPSALAAAFVFAAGRFGADVGAAIVFPVGRRGRRGRASAGRRSLALLALGGAARWRSPCWP